MADYSVQVDRGVALLDREVPDWRIRIDESIFDMKKLDSCVLCQLFGGYAEGLDKLGVPLYTTDDIDCGFDVPKTHISDEAYTELTSEWKKRLKGVSL